MINGIHPVGKRRGYFQKAAGIAILCCSLGIFPLLKGWETRAAVQPDGPNSGLLGSVVPSLPAATEAGEKIDLTKATRGWKVIYFWSSTCPCVRVCQSLSLFPLFRAYKERGVAFYAVASNPSDIAIRELGDGTKRAFLRLNGIGNQFPPYPTVIDADQKVAVQLKAHSAAQTFLLDPQNRIVFSGDPDDAEEIRRKTGRGNEKKRNYLADALSEAFAGKKISRPVAPTLGCEIERPDKGEQESGKP